MARMILRVVTLVRNSEANNSESYRGNDANKLNSEQEQKYKPKRVSSPISLPYFVMQSPNCPSGCGYRDWFDWPLSFDIDLTAESLAREAEQKND